jgi:hypothetical protein
LVAAAAIARAEWAADEGSLVVFTPSLKMAQARLGKAGFVMPVVLGVAILAPVARLALDVIAFIREFRAAPNAAALIFPLVMALALLGFFWFILRWMVKGGTFLVADSDGLAVTTSVTGSLGAIPQQRSRWPQVTDLELNEIAGMPCIQFRTGFGVQRLGMGLDQASCERVLETMSQLRKGAVEPSRAQA